MNAVFGTEGSNGSDAVGEAEVATESNISPRTKVFDEVMFQLTAAVPTDTEELEAAEESKGAKASLLDDKAELTDESECGPKRSGRYRGRPHNRSTCANRKIISSR